MKKNKINKFKIRKSVTKRFKMTGSGKIIRRGAQHRHLAANSSKSSKRRSRVAKQMGGKMAKKIKKMMGK